MDQAQEFLGMKLYQGAALQGFSSQAPRVL